MAKLDVREVDVRGKTRWAFLVDGEFVDEEFHPRWGLNTYRTDALALEAGTQYLKRKGLLSGDA